METLNTAFFFVTDKIMDLQAFFLQEAWNIGRIVLLISLSLAALNYAISGQGFKESLVKIGKAVVFFAIVMGMYPRIIGTITEWTFQKAYDSTYGSIRQYAENTKTDILVQLNDPAVHTRASSFLNQIATPSITVTQTTENQYFTPIVKTRKYGDMTYSVVAPAAVMEIVLIIAGDCLSYADKEAGKLIPNLFGAIKGLLCGLAVIVTGIFAMIEYLLAFLEFMLVTSVGIILFPLSLWEGSKFMAEKLIGAIVGFFIKLLFCNICIFLLLFGYISLLKGPTFTGTPEDILVLLFISLIFFYICKSAPGLAQSLLTGTPSLSAAGAIGAVGGAISGAAGAMRLAKSTAGGVGGAVAGGVGGVAKAAFAGAGMLSQAMGAAGAVKTLGGGGMDQRSAFVTSMGKSAKEAALSAGGDLARSLTGGRSRGGGAGSPGGGLNRHSRSQAFHNTPNADGNRQTYKEFFAARKAEGVNDGVNYMADHEKSQNLVKQHKERNKKD